MKLYAEFNDIDAELSEPGILSSTDLPSDATTSSSSAASSSTSSSTSSSATSSSSSSSSRVNLPLKSKNGMFAYWDVKSASPKEIEAIDEKRRMDAKANSLFSQKPIFKYTEF